MSLVNKFLEFIGIDDPDEEQEEDLGFEEEPAREANRFSGRRAAAPARQPAEEELFEDEQSFAPARQSARTADAPRRSAAPASAAPARRQPAREQPQATYPAPNGSKMIVYHPASYEDTQNIIDNIKKGKPVVVNLEDLEVEVAQRILDFLSGAVYALDGTMSKISRGIFIVAPANYEVVGSHEDDYDGIM